MGYLEKQVDFSPVPWPGDRLQPLDDEPVWRDDIDEDDEDLSGAIVKAVVIAGAISVVLVALAVGIYVYQMPVSSGLTIVAGQ